MKNKNSQFENGNNIKNPFEMGKGYRKYTTSNDNFQKNKTIGEHIISVVLFISLCVSIFMAVKFYMTDYRIFGPTPNYEDIEPVENYMYDFKDMSADIPTDPFPNPIPNGKNYTVNSTDNDIPSVNGDKIKKLVVGVDVEPGIYTIISDGFTYLNVKTAVEISLNYEQGVKHYNIPLIEGDEINIEFPEYGLDDGGSVKIIPQTEYVDFDATKSGVFVYGLNQFESEVTFENDTYSDINYGYNDPQNPGYYAVDSLYDTDITLPGTPGSYFAIDYNFDQV